ncbi:MAG: alkaline phosphatase family protein [Candidatus Omnitrophota bacterium]
MSSTGKKIVSLFLLVDALGWDYIKNVAFLDTIAKSKRGIKSSLGFSSGVIPSILTGKMPQEHKHWSLYFYSPKTSPFKWTKSICWLPKKILRSRVARKIVKEISKRVIGYTGYFETYAIPVDYLHLFDISENKNIYQPGGIRNADSIFDVLKEKKVDYKCFTYPIKDMEIFAKARQAIKESRSSFYFLYFSESDAYLHKACKDKKGVQDMIDSYDKEITALYQTAIEEFEQVNLFVFSDHSMAPVYESYDLRSEIEKLSLCMPKDYVAFYDSTMARFWFFNDKAMEEIVNVLKRKNYGYIISDQDKKRLGVDFKDNMYGEVIFLMNTGSVINPSYMGNKVPEGMHGYSVDDGAMDAIFVSNADVGEEIRDVRDFYKIMLSKV